MDQTMQKSLWKKALSAFLAIVLVFGFTPIPAQADGGTANGAVISLDSTDYYVDTDGNHVYTYTYGDPINVTTAVTDSAALQDYAWVGIYGADETPGTGAGTVTSYFWYYIKENGTGSLDANKVVNIFDSESNGRPASYSQNSYNSGDTLEPGKYKVILFEDGGYTAVQTICLEILAGDSFDYQLNLQNSCFHLAVNGDEPDGVHDLAIQVSATGQGLGEWVGVYKADATPGDDLSLAYFYVDGTNSGEVIDLTSNNSALDWWQSGWEWTTGDYKVILFCDDGYDKPLKEIDFTIAYHSYELTETLSEATDDEPAFGRYVCTECGNVYDANIHEANLQIEAAIDELVAEGITLESADAIADLRSQYEALKSYQKNLFSASHLASLEDAEAQIASLQADKAAVDNVSALIASLPAKVNSAAKKTQVETALVAYDALTDDQRAVLSSDQIAALKAAKAAVAQYEKTVTVNKKKVTAASVKKAIKTAGTSKAKVTNVVVGKKAKKISAKAFKSYPKVKTITIKSKKLTAKSVKSALKGSNVTKVVVDVGGDKADKKFVKKYKKIFTKANCGKKVKVVR